MTPKFRLKPVLILAFMILANTSAALAEPTEPQIYGTLTLPIVLDQEAEIESVDIAITFDDQVLYPTRATLEDVLEEKGYVLSSPINTRSSIERKIIIYAGGDAVRATGEVAFVHFDIIGNEPASSALSLTNFTCNASPAAGGFRINDTLCQHIRIIRGPDISNDGKTGIQDAIYMLQILSEMRLCYSGDIGLSDVIGVLQVVSGVKAQVEAER